jgi:hypothetical protein
LALFFFWTMSGKRGGMKEDDCFAMPRKGGRGGEFEDEGFLEGLDSSHSPPNILSFCLCLWGFIASRISSIAAPLMSVFPQLRSREEGLWKEPPFFPPPFLPQPPEWGNNPLLSSPLEMGERTSRSVMVECLCLVQGR